MVPYRRLHVCRGTGLQPSLLPLALKVVHEDLLPRSGRSIPNNFGPENLRSLNTIQHRSGTVDNSLSEGGTQLLGRCGHLNRTG